MKRKVAVLCGSESDFSQIASSLALLRMAEARGEAEILPVEVCSAHRNPEKHKALLRKLFVQKVDAAILCAGKRADLFGNSDAISRNEIGNAHTCFIAVPLRSADAEASQAAHLAAKQVPDSQFVFREEFFENPETAFEYAINGELPEIVLKKQKAPQTFDLKAAYHKGRRKYPAKASCDGMIEQLELGGLIHMYTGKTRETFINPAHPELLYILATDRISIFDIVMDATIPGKGADLTMMTVHWLKNVFSDIPNHLVAYGAGIMEYLPTRMRGMLDASGSATTYLMKNMLVVKRTRVLKTEAIVRGYLTGSGLKDYKATGKVCGIGLPAGLIDGSELPEVIFTPSTKADYGLHDENISFEEAVKLIGQREAEFIRDTSLHLYHKGRENLLPTGIILADTKFEYGVDMDGGIILIDEILTPDSSRFWLAAGLKEAMAQRKTPPSFDKQPIRIEGEAAGIKDSNPGWVPSEELIAQTVANYRHMAELATGMTRERFWRDEMGISE